MTSDSEQQRPRFWGIRPTLIAVAVAIVIGALGGAAIYAATEGSSHAMSGSLHISGGQMHAAAPGPAGPPPPSQAPSDGVLHSEYVVADGHGGFVTKMSQTGIVDEVTLSSIVVRSDDGFTQIYGFPSAAPNHTVAANDTVTVQASRDGATLTLTSIDKVATHGN